MWVAGGWFTQVKRHFAPSSADCSGHDPDAIDLQQTRPNAEIDELLTQVLARTLIGAFSKRACTKKPPVSRGFRRSG